MKNKRLKHFEGVSRKIYEWMCKIKRIRSKRDRQTTSNDSMPAYFECGGSWSMTPHQGPMANESWWKDKQQATKWEMREEEKKRVEEKIGKHPVQGRGRPMTPRKNSRQLRWKLLWGRVLHLQIDSPYKIINLQKKKKNLGKRSVFTFLYDVALQEIESLKS